MYKGSLIYIWHSTLDHKTYMENSVGYWEVEDDDLDKCYDKLYDVINKDKHMGTWKVVISGPPGTVPLVEYC